MANLPILATRGTDGLVLYQGQEAFTKHDVLMKDENQGVRVITFSDDGTLLAYCNGVVLKVLSMVDGSVVYQADKQKTVEIVISPNNRYIATWEQFYTTPQNPQGSNNFEIVDMKSNEAVTSMIHKNQVGWTPIWTKDELVCGRCVTNEVQFYTDGDFRKASTKLYLQNVSSFSISPNLQPPYMVAAYVQGKKGQPSAVRLFQYPNFGDGCALANKSFFKADKVDVMWNKKATALVILVSADKDTTGASYYGEQSLHFMNIQGESNIIHLEKRGPIYSVDWNPNSSSFCVVYGYMPAKATLFDMKCEPIFDFGTGPRNICSFNPHGNILCLCGFGNLNGYMEMWNVDGRKMVAKPQAEDTTYMEWCPDGQHLVTSTCAPRLRIGNGYKIWHYTGKVLQTYDVPKGGELWQTKWQTQPASMFPVPKILSGVTDGPKAAAYRPPSARGTAEKKLLIHEDELPQNQKNAQNMSASALKNKKKREAKAKAKQEQPNGQPPQQPMPTQPQQQADAPASGDVDVDKKVRAVKKKLRQIEELKTKQRSGVQLESNQLEKISGEAELLKELASFKIR